MAATTDERRTQVTGEDPRSDLPAGLITFVFTDIEASTQLYRAIGDAAPDAFEQHNQLLRACWVEHNGHEVHTEGDSFFVVFESAADALRASIAAQRSLREATWPEGCVLRIRVGMHSGVGVPRYGDYMALAVHQAARVMSAAHGDQILATAATLDQLAGEPLDGIDTINLGEFRIRDFEDDPTLFRIVSADGHSNPAPVRALPAAQHNLVPALTSFVGRDHDVCEVDSLLQPGRIVNLVGPGGIGKTRLANEVGLAVSPHWAGGVWLVELAEVAPSADAELVAAEIGRTLGVSGAGTGDAAQALIDHLRDTQAVVILDNVEQIVESCSELVGPLLGQCPGVALLVTSREPLNVGGEIIFRLQPLAAALPDTSPADTPSIQLFLDRALAANPRLELEPDHHDLIATICHQVDGLPLAIEIAAAQCTMLRLGEIRDGLIDRFRLLRSRDRQLPDRHRTIDGLLGWSYRLLTPDEQCALRRLAVFGGTFSLDAAIAVLADTTIDEDDAPELLWALTDKSLIAIDRSESVSRYRLPESVQQYALRLLIDSDDPAPPSRRLAQWLLDRVGPWIVRDRPWLNDVGLESSNILAAIELVAAAEPDMALQLGCSIGRYHDAVQRYRVGVTHLERVIGMVDAPSASYVACLTTLAELHLRIGETDTADGLLATAQNLQADLERVPWDDVATERVAGEIALRTGKLDEAIAIASETLEQRDISPASQARMWSLLGIAQSGSGQLREGLEAFERELNIYASLNVEAPLASTHGNIAEAAWRLGDRAAAAKHQRDSLDHALAHDQKVLTAYALIMAARMAGNQSRWDLALQLQQCAISLLEDEGYRLYQSDLDAMQAIDREAERALGGAIAQEARRLGGDLALLDAAELAREAFTAELQPSITT